MSKLFVDTEIGKLYLRLTYKWALILFFYFKPFSDGKEVYS